MPPIPYSRQWIDDGDVAAVVEALTSDFLTQGPVVPRFEAQFGHLHEVDHAIAVANATAGLHIACLALDVGPGARVWTSPNSFVASANCARYCGALVDFVDIDPLTRNMSIAALAEKLADASAAGTLPKVVIPVHFSGLPCEMRKIRALADRYGFAIIEDASHAVGAVSEGKPVGAQYSDIAVFSFHAVKIVTTAEGGMCTTQNTELAKRMRLLRSHGITRDPVEMVGEPDGPWHYEQVELGFNYRLTELQAALGLSQLARLEAMQAAREALAARYDRLLGALPLILPARTPGQRSAHHLYVVEIDDRRTSVQRGTLFAVLRENGIGANVHYIPIHTQPDFARLGFRKGDFPASEHYYSRAITLPLFPRMTEAQQDEVVDVLAAALKS